VAEKHYKYYVHRPTDYSQMLKVEEMRRVEVEGAEVYAVEAPAGAYLVKGFMDVEQQYQIGFEAMNYFVHRPYRTNLDGTNGLYLETKEEKQERKGQVEEREKEKEAEEEKVDEGKKVEEGDGSSGYYFDERVRMANLGYQYDWPHRSYPKTKVPIPPSIQSLTARAQQLFQRLCQHPVEYYGEAVIVNYYK
jgi:alkylated DNA repair protein alkB family protein 1